MLRTIQVEKLALGLCVVIVYALGRIPQAMSAAKVTTPSRLQYVDLTVGNGMLPKPAIRCQFTVSSEYQATAFARLRKRVR
jgi:hypothetical protein